MASSIYKLLTPEKNPVRLIVTLNSNICDDLWSNSDITYLTRLTFERPGLA